MDTDARDTTPTERGSSPERDASDVVDGPVGDAHLVDPSDPESLSADLEALPGIDGAEPPDAGHERPAADTL
jgi:hypothetical protein